jgi:tetratricopeptide (TPR) repeat protein
MKLALPVLLAPALLLAQTTPGLDPAFFNRDPKVVMVGCADKARAASPKDSRMLADFGRIYLAAGERERALDAFKRAAAMGRKDATTHALIARAWLQQSDLPAALAAARTMAELGPRNRTLLARAGVDFSVAGHRAEGQEFMAKAYKLDPTDWQMTVDFGRACLKGKDLEGAALWFRRTLTGRTDEDQVWKAVGLAYAETAPLRQP